MDSQHTSTISTALRSALLDLARRQEELAASVAAATPYWAPCPASAVGHRAAAAALRAEAERPLVAS